MNESNAKDSDMFIGMWSYCGICLKWIKILCTFSNFRSNERVKSVTCLEAEAKTRASMNGGKSSLYQTTIMRFLKKNTTYQKICYISVSPYIEPSSEKKIVGC